MAKKKVTKKKRSSKNTKSSNAQKKSESARSGSSSKKKKKKTSSKKKKVTVKNKYAKKNSTRNQGSWNGMKFGVSPAKANPMTAMTLQKGIEIDEESSNLNYSPATVELTATLVPELGNNVVSQYKKWTSMLKKYAYLFFNGKKMWAVKLMLKDVSIGAKIIDDFGQIRSADITLTFEEWDASQRASVHKKYLKEQSNQSSSKKTTISKGKWVKIKVKKYYDGKTKISAAVRKKKWKVKKVSGSKVYLEGLKLPIKKSGLSLVNTSSSGVSGSGTGAKIAKAALGRKGKPYAWGATGPNSFDCSGLVWWAHKQCGVKFTRTDTKGLSSKGKKVSSLSSAKAGDTLIFSSNGAYSGVHHTGIYLGSGKMVHAPHTGAKVCVVSVKSGYYKKQLYTIRRLY